MKVTYRFIGNIYCIEPLENKKKLLKPVIAYSTSLIVEYLILNLIFNHSLVPKEFKIEFLIYPAILNTLILLKDELIFNYKEHLGYIRKYLCKARPMSLGLLFFELVIFISFFIPSLGYHSTILAIFFLIGGIQWVYIRSTPFIKYESQDDLIKITKIYGYVRLSYYSILLIQFINFVVYSWFLSPIFLILISIPILFFYRIFYPAMINLYPYIQGEKKIKDSAKLLVILSEQNKWTFDEIIQRTTFNSEYLSELIDNLTQANYIFKKANRYRLIEEYKKILRE